MKKERREKNREKKKWGAKKEHIRIKRVHNITCDHKSKTAIQRKGEKKRGKCHKKRKKKEGI